MSVDDRRWSIQVKPKIFVDGQEGTTGLRIHEYLAARADIDVLKIEAEKRKDLGERKRLLNAADVAILCLPDVASRGFAGSPFSLPFRFVFRGRMFL